MPAEPQADLLTYAETLLVQYTGLAVLREQCRAALVEEMGVQNSRKQP